MLQSGSRDRAEVFGLGVLECIDSNNKRTALSKNYLIIIKNKGEDSMIWAISVSWISMR